MIYLLQLSRLDRYLRADLSHLSCCPASVMKAQMDNIEYYCSSCMLPLRYLSFLSCGLCRFSEFVHLEEQHLSRLHSLLLVFARRQAAGLLSFAVL